MTSPSPEAGRWFLNAAMRRARMPMAKLRVEVILFNVTAVIFRSCDVPGLAATVWAVAPQKDVPVSR